MKTSTWFLSLLFLLGLSFSMLGEIAPPVTVDGLLTDLTKDNGPIQARARQLLPRFGVEAVPGLVKLLGKDQEFIWRTAWIVLRDIANQPGAIRMDSQPNPPARIAVVGALMPLLAEGTPLELTKRVLSLLPLLLDEDTDISPIVALLKNPDLRERARNTLEETGTISAVAALAKVAAEETDPTFQDALMVSLFTNASKLKDLSFAVTLCKNPSGPVRASAARLLSETANPDYMSVLLDVAKKSDEASSFAAWDACLRFADTLAKSGGKWESAMSMYREVLKAAPDTVLKGGAIAGMGRYGDDSVVPLYLEVLNGPDKDQLASPILQACCGLVGHAADLVLLAVYEKMPEDLQPGLLENFGLRGDPMFLEVLKKNAGSESPAKKLSALKGLSSSGLPEAASELSKAVETVNAENKPVVDGLVKRLADGLAAKNNTQGAGLCYLALYRHAADPELKAIGLEGIRKYPVPEAFDVVMEMLKTGQIDSIPAGSMIGIAKAAIDAGKKEEGQKILDGVMGKLATPEAVQQTVAVLATMPGGPEMAAKLGFIKNWSIVGPFSWKTADGFKTNFIGEPAIDLKGSYPGMNGNITWKQVSTDDLCGMVNLAGLIGMMDSVVAFAYTEIEVAKDTDIMVHGGSDDGLKIWMNGEVVSEQDVDRPFKVDSDNAPAKLKAGKNALLAMISQRAGGWNFGMRLSLPDGRIPEFKVIQPQP